MNTIPQNYCTQPLVDEFDMQNTDNVKSSVSPHWSAVDFCSNPTPIIDDLVTVKTEQVNFNQKPRKAHNSMKMSDLSGFCNVEGL